MDMNNDVGMDCGSRGWTGQRRAKGGKLGQLQQNKKFLKNSWGKIFFNVLKKHHTAIQGKTVGSYLIHDAQVRQVLLHLKRTLLLG